MNCGYEADDNAKFCIRCGSRFSDKSAEIEKSEATDRAERSDKSERSEENAVFPDAEKQLTVEELTGRDFSSSADGAAKAEAPSKERRIGAEWQGLPLLRRRGFAFGNDGALLRKKSLSAVRRKRAASALSSGIRGATSPTSGAGKE